MCEAEYEKCGNCDNIFNPKISPHTHCSVCKKFFCFAMHTICFTEYHIRNKLSGGHSALSIFKPNWETNLRTMWEGEEDDDKEKIL